MRHPSMSSRTLCSVLRSRASVFKPRQFQPVQGVSCPGLVQTRFYTQDHDDPFDDKDNTEPSKDELLNINLRELINNVPFDKKLRYIKDESGATHPIPDPRLLEAMYKPMTLPYTVGTDICNLDRITKILERQIGELKHPKRDMPRLWSRVLTPLEARYNGWRDGKELKHSATFIGGRWAAKEAIMKAFMAAYPALDKVFMHNIVILGPKVQMAIAGAQEAASRISSREDRSSRQRNRDGESQFYVLSEAPRAFVRVPTHEVGWVEVSLSISHDGGYATATALVTVDPKIAEMRRETSLVRPVISKTYTDLRYPERNDVD